MVHINRIGPIEFLLKVMVQSNTSHLCSMPFMVIYSPRFFNCLHMTFLYRWLKADTWLEADPLPIGRARIARPGKHATVVAFSAMVPEALRAAEELAATSGYELEVVDLRTVKPLDTDTILASVARTARLMVVSEDFPWGGVAAEVIARVATEGMHLLDAPPLRVTAPDTPIPAHPDLWKAHRPGYENITAAARYLISL